MNRYYHPNDWEMWLAFMLVLIIALAGCTIAPDFGKPIAGDARQKPEKIWFPEFPDQYAVKHLVSMKLGDGSRQEDWLAYLLVKGRDFRLLAMNELGMTLFDIYAADQKPIVVVKPCPLLTNRRIAEKLAQDIRQVFLARSLLSRTTVEHYRSSTDGYILVQRPASDYWWAWEIAAGRPNQIRCGHGDTLEKNIAFDYSAGTIDKGFPRKITIDYRQMRLAIIITVLAITARDITDAQFIPDANYD